ncbi:uncharacterized protein LOC116261504 isoform X1 [Nymphaea colorata]|nr:uncharacterized protein LOC116261504 isoform X1 [Nymphaea colorata]
MGSICAPPSSLLTRTLVSCPFLSFRSQSPTVFSCKRLRTRLQESSPRVSISPPPLDFDYRLEFLPESKSEVAELHPRLLDLVERGRLVLVKKSRLGSRRGDGFVEPEMIWIIGVNHVDAESAADVERVVKTVRPDNVVVELCRSRAGIMFTTPASGADEAVSMKSNMFSLSGQRFFGDIGRSLSLGGQSALALRLLFAMFSSKISSSAGRSFGDEFRAARSASEEIGAQIVLGDRPIEITLGRAWRSLKWDEKLKLLKILFQGISSSNLELTERVNEDLQAPDSPSQLYKKLSLCFPSLLQPLMYERDVYLAWSLKRSKAVNNCKQVVGVIGESHMNGVIHALASDQGQLRFRDLVGGKWPASSAKGWLDTFLKGLVRDTVIGIVIWVLFEKLKAGGLVDSALR